MGLFKKVWDAMKDTANELKNKAYERSFEMDIRKDIMKHIESFNKYHDSLMQRVEDHEDMSYIYPNFCEMENRNEYIERKLRFYKYMTGKYLNDPYLIEAIQQCNTELTGNVVKTATKKAA